MKNELNIIVNDVLDRLHQKDGNYIAYFIGGPGTGKSESSVEYASLIDHRLDNEHVVFSVQDFFELLNSGTLSKGNAIVMEEMGIQTFRRDFFSAQNKAMVMFMEAGRALNLALIMNAPSLSYIDSGVVKMGHQIFETKRINRRTNTCLCRVHNIEYDSKKSKIYYKSPRYPIDGRNRVVEIVKFQKPADDLIIPYKEKKMKFLSGLNVKLEDKMKGKVPEKVTGPKPQGFDYQGTAQKVIKNIKDYLGPRGNVSEELINGIEGCGFRKTDTVKTFVEKMLMEKKNSCVMV